MNPIDEADAIQCVGLGWAPLIRRLYAAMPEGTEVMQVKEKFGGLRFYTNGTTDIFYAMIDEAEKESYTLCEWCGNPGTIDDSTYWVITLCEQHKQQRAAGRRYSREAAI